MRRTSVLMLVAVLLVFGAIPASAGNGKGELTSAFNHEINDIRKDQLDRPDGHFTALYGLQGMCNALVTGTWWSTNEDTRDEVDAFTSVITLDGEVLDTVRTQPKKMKIDGETRWGVTEGVPVVGTLDDGVHTIEYEFFVHGVFWESYSSDIDVSDAHC